MKNNIGSLEEDALIDHNYSGNHPSQMPIYIWVDWETGEISAGTRNYQIGGTPSREWNGYIQAIRIPNNIDAETLAANIDQYYLTKLDTIREGWEEFYNGNQHKGHLSENAQDILMHVEMDLEAGVYLSEIDEEKFLEYLRNEKIIDEDGNEM